MGSENALGGQKREEKIKNQTVVEGWGIRDVFRKQKCCKPIRLVQETKKSD